MPFDLRDTQFHGPALPEPFVKFQLENELTKLKLLPKTTGSEGQELKDDWDAYRRHLAQLAVRGGFVRVRNQVIEPLSRRLGYTGEMESAADVETREGREDGGYLLTAADGGKLRVWTTDLDEDLDAPAKRGQAYRFSHLRIAQRVLLACGERVGLLTNGVELRLLISDPARPDSHVIFTLDPSWKRSREVPDSFRLLLALASPAGIQAIGELVEKARLQQARVTKDLRDQARQAIGRFIQEVLEHPDNQPWLVEHADRAALARTLWHEGLVIVYRLLFVLKLESSDDPARSFTFASTSLWRNTFSPSLALARYAPKILGDGIETGGLLEQGLRSLFRMFHEGLECTELNVKPLGGALFGADATPLLSRLRWGERAVAHLLDQLLWTTPKKKGGVRERVHYGPLDVEDLGRVYEALLELEPGISSEPMCRLRRQKLEVVVPIAQGQKYRPLPSPSGRGAEGVGDDLDEGDEPEDTEEAADEEDEAPQRGKKTTVQWIEEIPPQRFYLRVGLGRKATGSYYTPHSFVRFLVQETLGPQVAERSPPDEPQPGEILKLKVLDPAMGSGHFLVEACRFLGQHLYEAARLCDEKATAAERRAEAAKRQEDREAAHAEARQFRQRIIDLPDPDDEIVRYLPSRSVEGEQSGVSQRKAEALCRRMIAVHCLYGVDKNPLAVELAKLALWLESHAEGMPLTFLDHRLVVGDSLTGPFWERLLTRPGKPEQKLEGVIFRGLENRLRAALFDALRHVKRLESSVGVTLAEVAEKQTAKADLDEALLPFRVAAAAWAGGVMLGPEKCDDVAYAELLQTIATTHELPKRLTWAVAQPPGVTVPSKPSRKRTTEAAGLAAEATPGYATLHPNPGKCATVSRADSGLCAMIARGLGVDGISNDGAALAALVKSGRCVPALPYDLTFPEVFYPNGVPFGRHGFDAVLGNPPWDRPEVKEEEYWCRFDLEVLDYTDKEARRPLIEQIAADSAAAASGWKLLNEAFDQDWRIQQELYRAQSATVGGRATTGRPDLYRLFAERGVSLLRPSGELGWVLPSGFHANEGATGIRRLYLSNMNLHCCFSFENRKKLFEIDSRQKFAIIAATSGGPTDTFACAFYLHDDEWLYGEHGDREMITYTRDYVGRVGGEYLSFPECRTQREADLLGVVYGDGTKSFGVYLNEQTLDFSFGVELHRNASFNNPLATPVFGDAWPLKVRLSPNDRIPVFRGKAFWQFSDRGEFPIDVVAPFSVVLRKDKWNPAIAYYRIAFRETASSTNERTLICAILWPGSICNHKAGVEVKPHHRSDSDALALLAILNSYFADWQVRQKAATNVNAFVFRATRLPVYRGQKGFLSHAALRLTCNHGAYAPLWREQFDDAWQEPGKPPFTWPVLAGDDERWAVRAAIDAVVADAYGLTRDQYAHVLSTFSHASYRKAPELCLARFDELKQLGLDAFTRKYDPYWDIPLNENLPQPVIDLPLPVEATADGPRTTDESAGEFRLSGKPKAKRGRKQR